MEEIVKAFVTKYWLSKGILEVEGTLSSDDNGSMLLNTGPREYGYVRKGDYYLTACKARTAVEGMRRRKIASLKKQILRLENLEVTLG